MHGSTVLYRIQYFCQRDVYCFIQRDGFGSSCILQIVCIYADHDDCASAYFRGEWNLARNTCGGTDGACIVRFYVLKT